MRTTADLSADFSAIRRDLDLPASVSSVTAALRAQTGKEVV
jgi:hypothetical protein